MTTKRIVTRALFGIALLGGCGQDFEVWLVDQSDSVGVVYGGAIHIFASDDIDPHHPADATASEVIQLEGDVAALCFAQTGANPVRPHMLTFNSDESHAMLSFVASGHVVIFDAESRQPLSCFRTEVGAGAARQAHAAFPTDDDERIVVANQNGKKLERILTDYDGGAFGQDPFATIDLANCVTPSGAPCQAAGVRPDNAPICPVTLPDGKMAVTLRGGGMFVVDATTTPMSIVAEYDMDHVSGNGCGGTIIGNRLFITSGGGTAANLYTYEVYSFPTTGFSAALGPNSPAPQLVDSDDADFRDAHGVAPVGGKNPKYLWVADRGGGLVTTYRASNYNQRRTIQLGGDHDDPDKLTPDLLDISPDGDLVFASLRGPTPLSGDAHVSVGSQPGLAVIKVESGGKDGSLLGVAEISNINAAGNESADAHGLQVRLK